MRARKLTADFGHLLGRLAFRQHDFREPHPPQPVEIEREIGALHAPILSRPPAVESLRAGEYGLRSSAFFESSGQGKRVKIPRGPRHCHRGRPGQQTTGRARSETVTRPGRSPAAKDPEARRPAGRTRSRSGYRKGRASEFHAGAGSFRTSREMSRRTGGSNDDRGPARAARCPFPAASPRSEFRSAGRARALRRRPPAAVGRAPGAAWRDGALGLRPRPRHGTGAGDSRAPRGLRDVQRDRLCRPALEGEIQRNAPGGCCRSERHCFSF